MFRKTLSAILIGAMLVTSIGSTAFASVDPIIMHKDQSTTESAPDKTETEVTPDNKEENIEEDAAPKETPNNKEENKATEEATGVDPIITQKPGATESTPEYTAPEETPYSKAEDEAAKELTNVYLDLKDVDQTKIKSEMSREDANPIIKLAESIIEKMKELLNKLKQAFKETFYADRGTVTIKYLCDGKEIAEADVHNNLKVGEYTYAPIKIEGYKCGVEEQTVEVTKENLVVTCEFNYIKEAVKLPKQITIKYQSIELDEKGQEVEGSRKDIINPETGEPYTKVLTEENSEALKKGFTSMKATALDLPEYDVFGSNEIELTVSDECPQVEGTFLYTQAFGNIQIEAVCTDDSGKEVKNVGLYEHLKAGSIYRYTPEDIGEFTPKDDSVVEVTVVKNQTTKISVDYVRKVPSTKPDTPKPDVLKGTFTLRGINEDNETIFEQSTELTEPGTYEVKAPDISKDNYILIAGEQSTKSYTFDKDHKENVVEFKYTVKDENKTAVNVKLAEADKLMDEVLRYINNREELIGSVTVTHKTAEGKLLEKAVYKDLTIDEFEYEVKQFKNAGAFKECLVDGNKVEITDNKVAIEITKNAPTHTVEFIYE